jgi:hypothetical protein
MNRIVLARLLALSVSLSLGCGTSATIQLRNGRVLESSIVEGDERSLTVENNGETTTIERSAIRDIDHPGNVALTIGAILAAYGVANIAVGAPKCDTEGTAFCIGVFTPAVIRHRVGRSPLRSRRLRPLGFREQPSRRGSPPLEPSHQRARPELAGQC